MYHAAFVDVVYGPASLDEEFGCFLFVLALLFTDVVEQVSVFSVFHKKVDLVAAFEVIVEFYYVWVVKGTMEFDFAFNDFHLLFWSYSQIFADVDCL